MIKSLSMVLFLQCFFALPPAKAEKVHFSYSSLTGSQSPLWVAREAGFFKKHNIDADLVYIPGGSVDVQALLSGELQMGTSGPGAVIRSNLAGADLVYVAVGSNKLDFV